MKFPTLALFLFLIPGLITSVAQNYNMSNGTVNTCGGNFYDSGGPGGNYSGNENITQTFCSNGGAGTCLQVDFSSFNTRNSADYLRIYDGPNTSSPLIGTYYGNIGAFPFPILSSSGCLTFVFISNASQHRAGWSAEISCVPCPSLPGSGSDYFHPTTGMAGSFVGACMEALCDGTYYDDGGSSSNYATDIGLIYWSVCPDQAGRCLRANFHSFSTEAGYDYLYVLNGPTQNSPQFNGSSVFSGNCSSYQTCMGAGLGPFTSTDSSGCLTFRFNSDYSVTSTGWEATFDCLPCDANTITSDNNDCNNFTPLCSNSGFSGNSRGPGISSDGCAGCNLSETYSSWYSIRAQSAGTIEMSIIPKVGSDDYDFAVYGPGVSCSALGTPLRCSYSAVTGTTGIGNGANDFTEDISGDGWVAPISVTAGEEYRIMIDNWTAGGGGFDLEWGGTALLDCALLPVELLDFQGKYNNGVVELFWTTVSESNNDYFTIERSIDNFNFYPIDKIKGAGNSNTIINYSTIDKNPLKGKSYYRLKQTDFNGTMSHSDVIYIQVQESAPLQFLNISVNDEGIVTIEFTYDKNLDLDFVIANTMGQIIYNSKLHAASGINTWKITADRLRSGLYFASISDGISIKSRKFIY